MDLILKRFANLVPAHLVDLTRVVVTERNAVAEINKVYSHCSLGFALLACQVVRSKLDVLAASPEINWLSFRAGAGLAYTVLVGGVPLRIQPDVPEIREVLAEERHALSLQGVLFPEDQGGSAVLRLEIAQRPGSPVDQVFLYMVDPHLGTTLDRALVYDGSTGRYFDTAPLEAPPADVNLHNVVQFHKPASNEKKDAARAQTPANDDDNEDAQS